MAHLAKITGISGCERFLANRCEVDDVKKAKRFRSEEAAKRAAEAHIKAYPRVVQRAMKFEIVRA